MSSNFASTLIPNDVQLDSGLLYAGNTPLGVSKGNLSWDEGRQIEAIKFDGMRTEMQGTHRVVGYDPVIKGKLITLGTGSISQFSPAGSGSFTSANSGTYTPVSASAFFNATSYITNLRLIFPRNNNNGYWQARLPAAICKKWSLQGQDKAEAEVDVEFHGVLTGSAATTDVAPFVYEFLATIP